MVFHHNYFNLESHEISQFRKMYLLMQIVLRLIYATYFGLSHLLMHHLIATSVGSIFNSDPSKMLFKNIFFNNNLEFLLLIKLEITNFNEITI